MRTNDDAKTPDFMKKIKQMMGVETEPQSEQEDAADARIETIRGELLEVLVRHGVNFVGMIHFDFDNGRDGQSSCKGIVSRGHPHHVYMTAKRLWDTVQRADI